MLPADPDRAVPASTGDDTPALRAPLTEAQEGLWFAQRIDPDNPILNTGEYLTIDGPLDVDAFRRAVDAALVESDALAIRVEDTADGPVQVVDGAHRPTLEIVDLSGTPDPSGAAQEQMRVDMATPIDPTRDRLVAQRLFVLGASRFIWYQRLHHLVIDAYAMSLLNGRVADLYAHRTGQAAGAGTPFTAYARVVQQDRDYLASARRQDHRRFWREEFTDLPEVVGLQPGAAVTARTAISSQTGLPPAAEQAIHDLAARAGVPWPDVMVALTAAYVIRLTGGAETVVGVPSMERIGTAAARVPCMWMNVLPIRVEVDEASPIVDFVRQVATRLKACRRHGRYRSEQLRRDLGLLSGQRRLYGVLVNVLPFQTTAVLHGLDVARHPLGNGAVDDLTVTFRTEGQGAGLRLELDANPNLYPASRVQQHVERLAAFVTAAAACERLADVPTVTAAERHHWVERVNRTSHPVSDATLTSLIEQTMREHPARTAVVFEDRTLTYAEFDRASAALARRLAAAGARPGAIVAVALQRSLELMVTLVAVLRTGAAYLPIDPAQPVERNTAMLRSARPVAVVGFDTAAPLAQAVPLIAPNGEGPESVEPLVAPRPDDAAYVIYTSGSTGEPKGAVIQHHAIVNRLEWMYTHYGIGADDRILQKTPTTFDVSVWELFLAFLVGATLVVAPPDAHKDPRWLIELIGRHAITTLHFVPSMLALFLSDPKAAGLRVRRVFCSGEALPAALRDRFHDTVEAELHNLYGPTEAAVDVTWWDASKGDTSSPVPIGFPVWNTRMYVLDRQLRPLPAGAPGDLYIAGVQLAREYLNRPDLTQDRFIPDPFETGERMYRTGDVAQWRDDGAIEYLGRSDHQVKIRGNRIELGEIEAAIGSLGGVAQTAVIARPDAMGEPQLVAYLVPGAGEMVDPDAVRAQLARLVPDYMIPSACLVLDVLPLTRSGKLDRSALPAPVFERRVAKREATSDTERRLTTFVAEALGLGGDAFGVDDDFFSLGGHSIAAARVMLRVREVWGADLGLGTIFTHPTVARLAAVVDRWRTAGADRDRASDLGLAPLVRLLDGGGGQAPLFCVHPAGGISWCYGALARALSPARDVYGLQARGLDPDADLPARLDEMARDYVARVKEIQPSGPFHLAGWSVGGIVAHAMAVQLQSTGDTVATLALLDAYPSDCWRARPEPVEGSALRALLLIAGQNPDTFEAPLTRDSVIAHLRAIGHPLGTLSDAALTGVVRVVERNNALVREHFHQPFRGTVRFVRAALDHTIDGLSPDHWRPYVSGIEQHDVPFVHAHLVGAAAVGRVAPLLSDWMLKGERTT